MKHVGSVIICAALFMMSVAWAQPSARLTTMSVQQGNTQAQLTVSVLCDGEVQYLLTKEQLSITDNGIDVEEFSIVESSSPAIRNLFSTAIVLDASGSMSGAGNAAAKAAAAAFVDFMDGVDDEAAVLWFNTTVSVQQSMTTDTTDLLTAVQALPASGGTAVWDAMYQGIQLVAANGSNNKRSVIALTDGMDNASTRTPAEVIALAQQYNIRVFPIGLGQAVSTSQLQLIGTLTGGVFYQTPNAVDLQTIFTTIATFIGRGYDEHTVAYVTPDPDAESHTISIRVHACDDVTEASLTERATPGVTSVNPVNPAHAPFALGEIAPNPVSAGASAIIPYTVDGTQRQQLSLQVFDMLGRHVATLFEGSRSPGTYTARLDAAGLVRGTYLCRLSSGASVRTQLVTVR